MEAAHPAFDQQESTGKSAFDQRNGYCRKRISPGFSARKAFCAIIYCNC